MNQGYVKLWRRSLKSECWKNPNTWRFWCWCLMKASWEKSEVIIGRQKITLEPGQFVFGRRIAAEETGLSEQEIRTVLATSKLTSKLTIKSTNKFSIISIVNWDRYQSGEPENNQQINQQINQQSNHKQEERKNRKENISPPTPPRGKKTPQTPQGGDSGEPLPTWMPAETWKAFKEHRRMLKSPMSQKAEQLILRKLQAFMDAGQNPEEIINQSIEHGWKGVFPLNGDTTGKIQATKLTRQGQKNLAAVQAMIAKEISHDGP